MPTCFISEGRAASSDRGNHGQNVICRFLGVAKIPSRDGGTGSVDMDIFEHPDGEIFGVDSKALAEGTGKIPDFLNLESGRTLDLSNEPQDKLLQPGIFRFLKAF
jgi:hypothetical protein